MDYGRQDFITLSGQHKFLNLSIRKISFKLKLNFSSSRMAKHEYTLKSWFNVSFKGVST